MSYSTGEIAELCGVTVRTVQFYDKEGLLKPDGVTEGGRRLYSEQSLKTLQIICMYKNLGLSLSEIKSILSDGENCKKILISVLEEREKQLDAEIKLSLARRDSIKAIKEYLAEGRAMSRNSFIDVQKIMKGKKKLKSIYGLLLGFGLLADAAEIAFIVLWAVKGIWLPFAIGMPCVFMLMFALVAVYYKNVQYICTDCGEKFRPKFGKWFFASHTPKTRKLTCTHCGSKNYHTETYSD